MQKTFLGVYSLTRVATILLAMFLACMVVVSTDSLAIAEENTWQNSYGEYLSNLDDNDIKDWYFGDDYLCISEAISAVNNFLSDTNFDKEALKSDPIIIAVIDSGIGYAYMLDGETEVKTSPEDVYNEGVEYKLHPIFDDVLLKDSEGDYVFKNVAEQVKIRGINNTTLNTINSIDSEDIACALVDNTSDDHGTRVTGMVAMLIHKLGLEDYIKILPVKANSYLDKKQSDEKANYYANYEIDELNEALDFCRENGADIVNISYTIYNQNKDTPYNFSKYSSNMLIVAPAGDYAVGEAGFKVGYPASDSKVLGVMGYQYDNTNGMVFSDTSVYGSKYNIVAPDTDIISSINGDEYAKGTTTGVASSMASFASALCYFRYRGYKSLNFQVSPSVIIEMIPYCASRNVAQNSIKYPTLNFANILKHNFHSDSLFLYSVGLIDEIVTGLEISSDIQSTYEIESLANGITINAQIVPDYAPKEGVEISWTYKVNGIEKHNCISGDWTVTLTPLDIIGKHTVVATITTSLGTTLQSNEISFSMLGHSPDDLKINKENIFLYFVGIEYEFSLPEDETYFTNESLVEWYVNGKKIADGKSFTFIPEEAGNYTITCTIDKVSVGEKVEITVYESFSDALEKNEIFGVTASIVFYLGVTKVSVEIVTALVIGIWYYTKKLKKQEEEFKDKQNDFDWMDDDFNK